MLSVIWYIKLWGWYKTVLQCLQLCTMMPRLIACEMKFKYAIFLSPSLLMFKSLSHGTLQLSSSVIPTFLLQAYWYYQHWMKPYWHYLCCFYHIEIYAVISVTGNKICMNMIHSVWLTPYLPATLLLPCVWYKIMSRLLVKRYPFLIVTITRTFCVCGCVWVGGKFPFQIDWNDYMPTASILVYIWYAGSSDTLIHCDLRTVNLHMHWQTNVVQQMYIYVLCKYWEQRCTGAHTFTTTCIFW
jgi:hypothetical protein